MDVINTLLFLKLIKLVGEIFTVIGNLFIGITSTFIGYLMIT